MKTMRLAIELLVVLTMLVVPISGTTSSVRVLSAPRIPAKEGTSTNWSGYAVYAAPSKKSQSESWTDVSGTWTVPAVSGSANSYSSIWVGLDGYSSNTVEQIGTEQDVNGAGVATYSAWYEMYPAMSMNISYAVSAGDIMKAEVQYTNKKQFVLTLIDTSKPWTFSVAKASGSAKRSSAEWIVEAPWSGGVLPLADFGTAGFSGAVATSSKTAGPMPISAFTNKDGINMVSGTVTKATTSVLGSDGATFSVTWDHN
ncbi:MAG: G1 family glutamic endopeptidase [Candidatus Cryosericum sp.]